MAANVAIRKTVSEKNNVEKMDGQMDEVFYSLERIRNNIFR